MKIKYLKIFLSIIIIASLIVFLTITDFGEVISNIQKFGYGFIWLIAVSALAYIMGGLAWKNCFVDSEKIPFKKIIYARTIGEIITIINPTNIIAGEASKVHLLDVDIASDQKIDSIIISRIILIGTQFLLTYIAFLWFFYSNEIFIQGFLISLLCIAVGILVIIFFNKGIHLITSNKKLINPSIRRVLLKIRIHLARAIRFYRNNKRKTFNAVFFSTMHWLLGATEIFLILVLIGVPIFYMDALLVDMGVVIAKSIGGFVPAQVGVEEFSNKILLGIAGVSGASVWITLSVIRRAKQVFWIVFSLAAYGVVSIFKHQKSRSNGDVIYHT